MSSARLLHVTLVVPHSGMFFLTDRLVEAYRSFGYQITVVGWDRLREHPPKVEKGDVAYEYIMRGGGFANWRLFFDLPMWTLRLASDMLTRNTDLVHATDFDGTFGVALGLRFRSIPFLYDIQDNFELRHNYVRPVRWLIQRVNAWIVRRSARTIVMGKERIVGPMRRLQSKIVVMPNCPPDIPPPVGFVADPTTLTIASVGRIAPARGILMLLEACRRLPWLRVEMAGVVETEELRRAIAAVPQVNLHGYLPQQQALELVHRSDLSFAFYDPSTEICHLANAAKWYDAMMASKLIFTNSEVLASQWLREEGCGIAVPYGDVEALTAKMAFLHRHRAELLKWGMRSRELYDQRFNRKDMDRLLHAIATDAVNVASASPEKAMKSLSQ